jgi:hypothetical protein
MGSFDTFLVRCPDCTSVMEFQTKARHGHGGEFEYFAADQTIDFTVPVTFVVPGWMREDLSGDEQTCAPCGRRVKLDAELRPMRMLNRGRKFDLEASSS